MTRKPRITKHKKGWMCRLGWMKCISDSPLAAFNRWNDLRQTFWRSAH